MGRVTPSFRQLYLKQIDALKKSAGFRDALLDQEHKKAFDLLLKNAWTPEGAALSNADVPCVLDIMNLMANVHNKKHIEELKERVRKLETQLHNI